MTNVLFLRDPSRSPVDLYELAFKSSEYNPVSVPVLETVLINLDSLKSIVRDGPVRENYAGVIITSARACEAWKTVTRHLVESSSIEESKTTADWTSIPFFVVGKGTGSALVDINSTYGRWPFAPHDIRGESSGTGEQLARLILGDVIQRPAKLLFLTGDKNRDTIPNALQDAGIELQFLQVYQTRGSSNFEHGLTEVIKSASKVSQKWWIVHFAPSAAGFVAPILRHHLSPESPESLSTIIKVAAIGPTTATYLREELNLHVDIVAPQPTPEDLLGAIIAHDQASRI